LRGKGETRAKTTSKDQKDKNKKKEGMAHNLGKKMNQKGKKDHPAGQAWDHAKSRIHHSEKENGDEDSGQGKRRGEHTKQGKEGFNVRGNSPQFDKPSSVLGGGKTKNGEKGLFSKRIMKGLTRQRTKRGVRREGNGSRKEGSFAAVKRIQKRNHDPRGRGKKSIMEGKERRKEKKNGVVGRTFGTPR